MAYRCTTKARPLRRGIAFALVATAFSACDPGGARGTRHDVGAPAPLEMIVMNDPETLDPRYVTDAIGLRTSRLLHAGLTRLDPATLRVVPYLASSFHWRDDTTLDVELRPGLRFHSGAPLTADDVVATFRAFADKAVASRHANVVDAIERVEEVTPNEVRFVLRRPHATLLADLDLPILRHDQAKGPPDATGEALDGLGPFEVERKTRGEILLRPARFGAYGELGPRERVALRTVHDENARALRLYSGKADIVMNGISPTLLPALESRDGLSVIAVPGANLTYMVVRVDRGPLADVRLRQAISLAIDRPTIAAFLFGHHATPADTVFPTGHWASTSDPEPLRFDPVAARALVDALTAPLARLTLLTSTDRLRMTVARTMAQELGDAGIGVDVVPLELGTLLARLSAGDFDLAALQLPELTEPNTLRVFLHGDLVPPAGANRGRIHDAELDRLLDVGDQSPDEDTRAAAYHGVERRLREALFIIPLWHEDQVAVVSERARDFRPTSDGRWLSLASMRYPLPP